MPKLRRIDLEDREGIRRELLRFVEELKEKLPVSQVYLFGSFACGKVHEESDIDLLIVGDFPERVFTRIERVLELTDLPIEPLVYTSARSSRNSCGPGIPSSCACLGRERSCELYRPRRYRMSYTRENTRGKEVSLSPREPVKLW